MAAAYSTDTAWIWVRQCEFSGTKLLSFSESYFGIYRSSSQEFERLDTKLKVALLGTMNEKGDLNRYVRRKEEEYQAKYTRPHEGEAGPMAHLPLFRCQ